MSSISNVSQLGFFLYYILFHFYLLLFTAPSQKKRSQLSKIHVIRKGFSVANSTHYSKTISFTQPWPFQPWFLSSFLTFSHLIKTRVYFILFYVFEFIFVFFVVVKNNMTLIWYWILIEFPLEFIDLSISWFNRTFCF